MPPLTIRLARNTDGSSGLICTRADGTSTWQRNRGQKGDFFPLHDLTHYAVETVLPELRGFYTLVADGWDLDDFAAPWPRGRLPADAGTVELIVGFLDTERASMAVGGTRLTAADFGAHARTYFEANGIASPPPSLTDAQLGAIRARRGALFSRWSDVRPGDSLELTFIAPALTPTPTR